MNLRERWNRGSHAFRTWRGDDVATVAYGPLGPTEAELALLGDVRGQRILDVGCGAGQTCVALARQGAQVSGLDLSDQQIAYAQALAAQHGVTVNFVQGDGEDLGAFASESQEWVLSLYTLHYMANPTRCLREAWRLLQPGGRLLISLDHPFRDCFYDAEEQEETIYPARSYFDQTPMLWPLGDTGIQMHSYHRTTSEWLTRLRKAGFVLIDLLEPDLPDAILDELWPEDSPLGPRRNVPQTIIFVAAKVSSPSAEARGTAQPDD